MKRKIVMYKRIGLLLLALVACFGIGYYFGQSNAPHSETIEVVHTDTVYVKHVPPVKLEKVTPPKKVRIQKNTDTVKRKAMEKKRITTGSIIKVSNDRVIYDVQTITPRGVVMQESYDYDLPAIKAIAVNDTGAVEFVFKTEKELRREKRKRRWQRIAGGVVVAIAFIAGAAY